MRKYNKWYKEIWFSIQEHFIVASLPIKKWLGKTGIWNYCCYCGEQMQSYGYNFQSRCENPDCKKQL